MIQTRPSRGKIPLIQSLTIPPHDDQQHIRGRIARDWHEEHIRRLIARDWHRPGKDIRKCTLMFTTIRGERGLTYVMLGLRGLPSSVLVPIFGNELAVRAGFAAAVYTRAETRALRKFVRQELADNEDFRRWMAECEVTR